MGQGEGRGWEEQHGPPAALRAEPPWRAILSHPVRNTESGSLACEEDTLGFYRRTPTLLWVSRTLCRSPIFHLSPCPEKATCVKTISLLTRPSPRVPVRALRLVLRLSFNHQPPLWGLLGSNRLQTHGEATFPPRISDADSPRWHLRMCPHRRLG